MWQGMSRLWWSNWLSRTQTTRRRLGRQWNVWPAWQVTNRIPVRLDVMIRTMGFFLHVLRADILGCLNLTMSTRWASTMSGRMGKIRCFHISIFCLLSGLLFLHESSVLNNSADSLRINTLQQRMKAIGNDANLDALSLRGPGSTYGWHCWRHQMRQAEAENCGPELDCCYFSDQPG